jgi:hypothetical protein
MIDDLIEEYTTTAENAASVDYSDNKSVRRYNTFSERMRSIVCNIVAMGKDAVCRFTVVLEKEPAAGWAAHHLVELADLDAEILSRCFKRVELAMTYAAAKGDMANAMGEEMWLKEWRAKNPGV